MVTNIELYESLSGKVGEEAARMISDMVPPAAELATKSDIVELKHEVSEIRGEMRASFRAVEARLTRWMLTFFVPLWLGVWGVIVTLLVKT